MPELRNPCGNEAVEMIPAEMGWETWYSRYSGRVTRRSWCAWYEGGKRVRTLVCLLRVRMKQNPSIPGPFRDNMEHLECTERMSLSVEVSIPGTFS